MTIVRCDCGAEYRRTDEKFLVPHIGRASCEVCGATLESWSEATHVPSFHSVKRPAGPHGPWGSSAIVAGFLRAQPQATPSEQKQRRWQMLL